MEYSKLWFSLCLATLMELTGWLPKPLEVYLSVDCHGRFRSCYQWGHAIPAGVRVKIPRLETSLLAAERGRLEQLLGRLRSYSGLCPPTCNLRYLRRSLAVAGSPRWGAIAPSFPVNTTCLQLTSLRREGPVGGPTAGASSQQRSCSAGVFAARHGATEVSLDLPVITGKAVLCLGLAISPWLGGPTLPPQIRLRF